MRVKDRPVRDATSNVRITVLPEDVAIAVPRSECDCAIAQAIKRIHRGRNGIPSVGREVVIIAFDNHVERYLLSPNDRALVRTFDRSNMFPEGYSVELRAPRGGKRLGKRGLRSPKSRRKGPKTTKNTNYPYHERHVKLPRTLTEGDDEATA